MYFFTIFLHTHIQIMAHSSDSNDDKMLMRPVTKLTLLIHTER